jgi:hypothetical protein
MPSTIPRGRARHRLLRRGSLAAIAGAVAASFAPPAAANGRYPSANHIYFSPVDANLVVLRATFGIVISHDAGKTWVWLCEDALGLSSVSSEDPSLGVTAGGSMVAGVSWAMEVSPDLGCSWTVLGGSLLDKDIVDVAVRPDAPHSIVALQSSYELDAGAGGGRGYITQVFESVNDGATWSPVGVPIDPGVVASTIEVAATDPNRLYVSARRLATEAGPSTASLFVSLNKGMSWTERPLPQFDPATEAGGVFIGAVDPTNADIVYLRSAWANAPTSEPSRLFVTRDAGQSFQVALTLRGQMLGFALSPDGSRMYAGGPSDGLLAASSAQAGPPGAFTSVAPNLQVQCLATRGSDLWACSNETSGFLAGASTNAGASFTPKLHFVDISAPIACAADAAAAQCSGDPFTLLCRMFGDCPSDAGPGSGADASPGDSGSDSPAGGSSGGGSGGSSGSGGSGSGATSSSSTSSGGQSGSSGGGAASPTGASGGCAVFGGGGAAGFATVLFGIAAVASRRRSLARRRSGAGKTIQDDPNRLF